MTFTMVFNLPDEQAEMENALQGGRSVAVLFDFDQRLRQIVKYETHPDDIRKMVEDLRTTLREMCEEYEVRLE